ncbi:MAG TPA: DNA-binding protein [Campylobacterales bacterium]|nr:DNA-binding protein [Campylobacterales bacterium]
MRTITLKTDDVFFDALGSMAKETGSTKSEIIRKAVGYYGELLEKDRLKKQIKEASFAVRKDSASMSKEFDDIIADGLDNV